MGNKKTMPLTYEELIQKPEYWIDVLGNARWRLNKSKSTIDKELEYLYKSIKNYRKIVKKKGAK